MGLAEDLLAVSDTAPKATAPKAGEPSIEWNGRTGSISTGLVEEPPKNWDDLVRAFGFDPDDVMVVEGSVNARIWDANMGGGEVKRFHYYKADLRSRTMDNFHSSDVDELCKALMRRKPVKADSARRDTTSARIICIGDPQIGKEGTAERLPHIVASIETAIARAKGAERIVLINLGDTIERCFGHYPGQTFTVELDQREQERVARRLWLNAVDRAAQLAPVDVLAVPSNHGEVRDSGKAVTRSSDNADLALIETVADIVQSTDRYPDVRFGFPPADDPLVVTYEAGGVRLAACHGHKLGAGTTPWARAQKWWQGQALGQRPAGDADILLTAHYHHLAMTEAAGRTWMQAPALDAGSQWWTDLTGQHSPSGVLSFSVGDFGPRCWGDLTLD